VCSIHGIFNPKFFGQCQAIRIDIGYDHVTCTNEAAHCCAHDANRAGTGNQYVFTGDIEGLDRDELEKLDEWIEMFEAKYRRVGRLLPSA